MTFTDDEGCAPTSPFEVVLGAPGGRRPANAGPSGTVMAAGFDQVLRFDDARGDVPIDVFVIVDEGGEPTWWLERDTESVSVSATATFGNTHRLTDGVSTFLFSVRGDCVAIDRVCACIADGTARVIRPTR